MFKIRITIISLCISILVCSMPILSCGSSDGDNNGQPFSGEGETFDLIEQIGESGSSNERIESINEVIRQGRSLGIVNENGEQLNPNVPDDAISLTPEDIASFSTFVEIGHYSTVGDVIDYLAEVGVVLSETGAVINPSDFLPDLQDYVDWAFRNGDDPDSQLGIMLGSGPEMVLPTDPPEMEASTPISPMAAVLMLGDILIGTDNNDEKPSAGLFTKVAHAADVKGTALRIQGLITKIESGLKPTNATISFFGKVGEKLGVLEKGTTENLNIKIPDVAKKIIGAFAIGSHFSVRLYAFKAIGSITVKDMPYLKSFEIDQLNQQQIIIPALVLVSDDRSAPVTVVEDEVPIMYTIRFLSPYEPGVGTDLYPDANAIITPAEIIASTTAGDHIMNIASTNEPLGGMFTAEAIKLENKEPRVALLHASASILTGDLSKLFDKYTEQYGKVISSLGLKTADLAEMFSALKTAVKVSPWVTEVILVGAEQVSIEPKTVTGPPQGYKFTAKVDNPSEYNHWQWEAYQVLEGQNFRNIDMSLWNSEEVWVELNEPGKYIITAYLWNGEPELSDNKVIDSASATVIVEREKPIIPNIEVSIGTRTDPPYEGGCSIGFIAETNIENDQLPENIRWEWLWGDGAEDTVKGSPHSNRLGNEINHVYDVHGGFTVMVRLYNDDNDTLLATATRNINVDNLEAIQRTKWVRAMVYCGHLEEISRLQDGKWVVTSSDRETFGWIGKTSHGNGVDLNWKGNEFSVTWDYTGSAVPTTFTISGTISEDVKRVKKITAREDYNDPATGKIRTVILTLTDVPILKYNCGDSVRYSCYLTGAEQFKDYVSYEYKSETPEQITKFTGFKWDSQIDTPKFELEFSAMDK